MVGEHEVGAFSVQGGLGESMHEVRVVLVKMVEEKAERLGDVSVLGELTSKLGGVVDVVECANEFVLVRLLFAFSCAFHGFCRRLFGRGCGGGVEGKEKNAFGGDAAPEAPLFHLFFGRVCDEQEFTGLVNGQVVEQFIEGGGNIDEGGGVFIAEHGAGKNVDARDADEYLFLVSSCAFADAVAKRFADFDPYACGFVGGRGRFHGEMCSKRINAGQDARFLFVRCRRCGRPARRGRVGDFLFVHDDNTLVGDEEGKIFVNEMVFESGDDDFLAVVSGLGAFGDFQVANAREEGDFAAGALCELGLVQGSAAGSAGSAAPGSANTGRGRIHFKECADFHQNDDANCARRRRIRFMFVGFFVGSGSGGALGRGRGQVSNFVLFAKIVGQSKIGGIDVFMLIRAVNMGRKHTF